MTRRSFRRTLYLTSIIPVWIACAQTEGGDIDKNGDGDGDSSSGGSTSTGGIIIGQAGGTTSTGGFTATGGDNALGGAPPLTTGGSTASGGATFEGACADYGPVSSVNMTGDFGIHTCTENRDSCLGVSLNEPALFECVSNHGPNCTSQTPQQGQSVWAFVALCSELGMGGATAN